MTAVISIITGLAVYAAAVFSIREISALDNTYGTFSRWHSLVLLFSAVFFSVVFGMAVEKQGAGIAGTAAGAVCTWLLLTASYMDQKAQCFSALLLWIALPLETAAAAWALASSGNIFDRNFLIECAACFFLLYLLSFFVYSRGDYGILCACMLAYVVILPSCFVAAVVNTLFCAGILYVIRHLPDYCRHRKKRGKSSRYPFTVYIAAGTAASILTEVCCRGKP